MSNKEAIMEATISLINEKEDHIEEITVRQISKRAGVGLGLINYHFENKEKLIEACVERIINGIVEKFRGMGEQTKGCTPFEKLDYLGNTQRTIQAFLPLVAQCRPDWDEEKVRQMTFYLISCMQLAFLRHEILLNTQGIDLRDPQERKGFHTKMLNSLIGTERG